MRGVNGKVSAGSSRTPAPTLSPNGGAEAGQHLPEASLPASGGPVWAPRLRHPERLFHERVPGPLLAVGLRGGWWQWGRTQGHPLGPTGTLALTWWGAGESSCVNRGNNATRRAPAACWVLDMCFSTLASFASLYVGEMLIPGLTPGPAPAPRPEQGRTGSPQQGPLWSPSVGRDAGLGRARGPLTGPGAWAAAGTFPPGASGRPRGSGSCGGHRLSAGASQGPGCPGSPELAGEGRAGRGGGRGGRSGPGSGAGCPSGDRAKVILGEL